VLLARLGRALLIAAFLLAQQGAFAHQVWHAGAATAGSVKLGTKGNPLCAHHGALDTVLGALSSAHHCVAVAEARPTHFPAGNSPAASTPPPSPTSRGPPAVL